MGKSAQKNPPGKSPAKSSEIYATKIPDTFLQRGRANKYRVEEMLPKWSFWKHRAPKMCLVEAQCAHQKHCYPEPHSGVIPLLGPHKIESTKIRNRKSLRFAVANVPIASQTAVGLLGLFLPRKIAKRIAIASDSPSQT